VSESRRNRRKTSKGKHKSKSGISRKDKIIGIFAISILFIIAAMAAYYYSLSKTSH
tara:strand:- start:69073 stop:69240 length:168 start_codon:yes stop_codon:yes gene_type:complete